MAYNHEYPYVDPYRYNDDWLLNKMKELIAEWNQVQKDWETQQNKFDSLQKYVTDYFSQLDLQEEINNKIDSMIADGELQRLLSELYPRIIDIAAYNPDPSNSTSAFQSAIADLNANKYDVLLISGGNYTITAPLYLNSSFKKIIGNGATINLQSEFLHIGTTTTVRRTDISGLYITGAYTVFTLHETQMTNLHNMYISNVERFCIMSSSNNTGVWTVIQDIIGNIRNVFVSTNGGYNGIHLFRCQINSELQYSGSTFVSASGNTDTIEISECLIQRMNYGCIFVADNGTLQDIYIEDVIFDGIGTQCITLTGTTTLLRIFIDHCWLTSNGNAIVTTGNVYDLSITDSNFIHIGGRAILTNNALNKLIINSCKCTSWVNNQYCFDLVGEHIIITSNGFYRENGTSYSDVYLGIRIRSGSNNVIVTNNDLSDVITTKVNIASDVTNAINTNNL